METVTLFYNLIYSAFTLSCLMDAADKRNYASSVTRVRVKHGIIGARRSRTASDFVVIKKSDAIFLLSSAIDSTHLPLLQGTAIIGLRLE